MPANLILILGGARSGKSSYAIELAEKYRGKITYLATAEAVDPEMAERIKKHRKMRSSAWKTVEIKGDLSSVLRRVENGSDLVILDCLSMLVSDLLENKMSPGKEMVDLAVEEEVRQEIISLINLIKKLKCKIVVVSNEVGQGVVPPYPLGRSFRDLLGMANQMIAQEADEVYWMVAGMPMEIKKPEDRKQRIESDI